MLNRGGIQIFADPFQNVLAHGMVIAHDAHFDEFVGAQAAVDFTGDCRCQAAAADQNGGIERMGAGFERAALDRRELQRHGNLLKQAF